MLVLETSDGTKDVSSVGSNPTRPTKWCLKHLGDVRDCGSREDGSIPSLHPILTLSVFITNKVKL
jgi:hypothetical protein